MNDDDDDDLTPGFYLREIITSSGLHYTHTPLAVEPLQDVVVRLPNGNTWTLSLDDDDDGECLVVYSNHRRWSGPLWCRMSSSNVALLREGER